jgi:hypothetical protein
MLRSLLAYSLHPEDGGYISFRNIGSHKSLMASHPRREYSSRVLLALQKARYSQWLIKYYGIDD